ncbi:hypothetical protein BGZ80_008467 [Entomortierella chlamydospora]|uniref:Sorting nexin/Vps5-like C-terminal domain-containing protein n=1 Tax=Entomortierella chlamydospora TaxID=101097 RepID=A0A9P6T435_9FUNG|nr:hypothetical protein BGZ80_008467 [Entomortierella chlamydospora]
MRSLKVSVPEAASSGGTITFKILVNTANSDMSAFVDYVIPPLPESLSEKQYEDVDQVEQKRVQIERFLQRTHLDSIDSKRATLGFLRFDNIIKPSYDRGMRMYRPSENVEENDQGEFQRRQTYILAMEQAFTGILDTGLRLTKEREKLGDMYSQLGDSTMEVLSSKYRLGDGQRIDNRERHQALDEEMQIFGVLSDDLRLSIRRQAKSETFYFTDLVHEYRGMLHGLKDVMNSRTDRLSEYVSASKSVTKRQARLEQAVQKSETSPAADLVDKAQLSLEGANAKLDEAREEFKKSQEIVTRELLRYEKDRAKEWQASVKDYAEKQVFYEKEKLLALEKAWASIQDLRTNAGGELSGGNSGVRGRGPEPSGRSRSYWPSGLGSPFAPDLTREGLTDSLQSGVASNLTPLVTESATQGRLPQNAGPGSANVSNYNNSGYSSGYNSGYNSGYTSGEQDEGARSEPGYFPATKLSRSGSGPRSSKATQSESTGKSGPRKGSLPEMTSSSNIPILTAAVSSGTRDEGSFVPNYSTSPLHLETHSKLDILSAEREDKNKDGYDPLMVRPGFTD